MSSTLQTIKNTEKHQFRHEETAVPIILITLKVRHNSDNTILLLTKKVFMKRVVGINKKKKKLSVLLLRLH
jgi:hypothetical protein